MTVLSKFTFFYLWKDFFPTSCLPHVQSRPDGFQTFYLSHGGHLWDPQLVDGQVMFRSHVNAVRNPSWTFVNKWPHPLPDHQFNNGFPNHTKVEVTHGWHELNSMTAGFWMYAHVGTAVFYDVGRTLIFRDQPAAEIFLFGHEGHNFTRMCEEAKGRGFDSLQFTHRAEMIYYLEIVDCRRGGGVYDKDGCPYGLEQHFYVLESKMKPWKSLMLSGGMQESDVAQAASYGGPLSLKTNQQQGDFGKCNCLPGRQCLNCGGLPNCKRRPQQSHDK
mmetsp:Transcript_119769/g.211746  ORF Transcript_119769/g.211746 Transcript_119769/m.211746 type:complete len:274 (-) Transcript_119769:30-851(-)